MSGAAITANQLGSTEDPKFMLGAGLALDPTGGYALISGDEGDGFKGALIRSRARLVSIRDARGRYMQELAQWSFDGMGLRLPATEVPRR